MIPSILYKDVSVINLITNKENGENKSEILCTRCSVCGLEVATAQQIAPQSRTISIAARDFYLYMYVASYSITMHCQG